MTRPTGWTEETAFEAYNPDSFVHFERGEKSNCLFQVIIVKKSEGASADKAFALQKEGWLKNVSDATVIEFDQWGNYRGQGADIEGKVGAKHVQRHRIFVFTKGDNVCMIIESAPPGDFLMYATDFKTIRESFRLK
jgi:hypothetical protein